MLWSVLAFTTTGRVRPMQRFWTCTSPASLPICGSARLWQALLHPIGRLSPRELELLRWIARGKSNTSIAQIMGVSRHTVDTIMRRLFGKLDVTDRTRAAVRGLAFGLIDPSLDNLS